MRLIVVLDHRFLRTPEGAFYGTTIYGPNYWSRYLDVFDSVRVLSRSIPIDTPDESIFRVDSDRVSFATLPEFSSLFAYLKNLPRMLILLRKELIEPGAVILRIPSNLCFTAWPILIWKRKPYGVELTGDPKDSFSKGAVKHPFRVIFKLIFPLLTKWICKGSIASNYVTETTLQHRYPPHKTSFHTHSSSIDLNEDDILDPEQRKKYQKGSKLRLITVGTFSQLYKGQDLLLDAVSQCETCVESLTFVGGGRYLSEIEKLAKASKSGIIMNFVGSVPSGSAVYKLLDESDLFVLPSRQEGLPRAMIEAMARGLPCIGTRVGGIPELIPERCLVLPNDPDLIAKKIHELWNNPTFLEEASCRNICEARKFIRSKLMSRRKTFYFELSRRSH